MPIKNEILDCLANIEDSLERIERKMDDCLVMANRIDWQLTYELSALNNLHLTFT